VIKHDILQSTCSDKNISVFVDSIQGGPKKSNTQFYFWDNFGNSAPILTILSLLQAKIYGP